MSDTLSGKPFVVTEEHAKAKWGCHRGGKLICKLCGHVLKAGETCRFVFANGKGSNGSVNFFACESCDGQDAIERGRASFAEAKRLAKQWDIYGPDWQER